MNTTGILSDEVVLAAIRTELIDLECIPSTTEVQLHDRFLKNLGVNGYGLFQLVMALEKHFEVDVKDDDIDYFYDGPEHGALLVGHIVHLFMGRDPKDFEQTITPVKVFDEQVVYAS